MGTWLSLFPNVETFIGQFVAIGIVVGSYMLAQWMRVWRPRRRGERTARLAEAPPELATVDRF
jgi:high-affinity iron transporter